MFRRRQREMSSSGKVSIIGGGLAGCEAAFCIARFGFDVHLYEMKPVTYSPAHQLNHLFELVCSNSLGNDSVDSAQGQLKSEMRQLCSLMFNVADQTRVPAGKALAVDRVLFAKRATEIISNHPHIHLIHEEVKEVPLHQPVLIATGPLTSDNLARNLSQYIGGDSLYFYDSISPIVTADSIDYSKTFFGNRYQPEGMDYLNCPVDEFTYHDIVQSMIDSEKISARSFESLKCFEACVPIEILAERGFMTLAFGPMKPVGLRNPKTGQQPFAVVQLRRENDPTTLYNLVGFQTRMKWNEQQKVFHKIPGLENAEFARFGSMHRNTYICSPRLLNSNLRLVNKPDILITGQLAGVEGYVESAAMGLWAGLVLTAYLKGIDSLLPPPSTTALGALLKAITTQPLHGTFSPMNMNFGLFQQSNDLLNMKKNEKRRFLLERARETFFIWKEKMVHLLGNSVTSSES